MTLWEIFLIGAALAMDAVAVSMSDGMAEPRMRPAKAVIVALTFALFQFAMPVAGYYCGYAFAAIVERAAPWISFLLLGFIGGKMIFDGVKELRAKKKGRALPHDARPLGMGKLFLQGVATSLDALAVGVTFLAAQTQSALPLHAVWCAAAVGAVTFALALPAVFLGKRAGSSAAEAAGIAGGAVLVAIGLKLLLEGLL